MEGVGWEGKSHPRLRRERLRLSGLIQQPIFFLERSTAKPRGWIGKEGRREGGKEGRREGGKEGEKERELLNSNQLNSVGELNEAQVESKLGANSIKVPKTQRGYSRLIHALIMQMTGRTHR